MKVEVAKAILLASLPIKEMPIWYNDAVKEVLCEIDRKDCYIAELEKYYLDCVKKLQATEKKIANLKKLDFVEDLPGEIWKDIEGYEGLYQISNKGRVKSFQRGKAKISLGNAGSGRKNYMRVNLCHKDLPSKWFVVHRLVADAFIPNPENKPLVNHIDGNKQNNCVENLEWVTASENALHAYKIGLNKGIWGAKNSNAKLTAEQVKEIRKFYVAKSREYGALAFAKKFNVSTCTIKNVIAGKSYQDVE